MAKTSPKTPAASKDASKAPEAVRLDEKLYQLSVKTAKSIRRFRITIITLICIAVLAIFGYWGFNKIQVLGNRSLSAQLYQLITPPTNPDADPIDHEAVLPDLEKLITSVRGKKIERWMTKDAVSFLLYGARQKIYPDPRPTPADEDGGDTKPPEDPEKAIQTARLLLGKAEEMITVARDSYPDDKDIKQWAEQNLAAIESLKKRERVEPKRSQKPSLPPAPAPVDPEKEPAPPTPEAPTQTPGEGGTDDESKGSQPETTEGSAPPAETKSAGPGTPEVNGPTAPENTEDTDANTGPPLSEPEPSTPDTPKQ